MISADGIFWSLDDDEDAKYVSVRGIIMPGSFLRLYITLGILT